MSTILQDFNRRENASMSTILQDFVMLTFSDGTTCTVPGDLVHECCTARIEYGEPVWLVSIEEVM